jgi:hypothetical protein
LFYFPEIKSKYRSENTIYRIFNRDADIKKWPQRHFHKQNIHIINVRDVNIGVWTDVYNLTNGVVENKIGVK